MKPIFWGLAIFFFFAATGSPLHFLAMHGYLSAHMIGHIVLLLICGPLLVAGLSDNMALFRKFSSFWSKHVWLAWIAGVGIMWFWHIPAVFNKVMGGMEGRSVLPLVHTVSLLLAGVLFSWPLFGPYREDRIDPLSGIIYLATACISCSLMGLLITFAPLGFYHSPMASSMIMAGGNARGLSPREDLQAAGLIMWVPCCGVYLAGCLFLLQRWLHEDSHPAGKNLITLNS